MKKLTKRQLNKIANMHSASVILATEPSVAFENSNLSYEERKYLDEKFTRIALQLGGGENFIFNADLIVKFVRENRK